MPSSTTLFSNSRNVQRPQPFGGLEQAKAINLASFSPSNMRGTAGIARCLRLKTASKPSSTSCLRTLLRAQPHDIFLYRNVPSSHDRLRRSNHGKSESSNPFKLVEAAD